MPKSRVEITNVLKSSKNTANKRDKACIIIAENNAKNMDALFQIIPKKFGILTTPTNNQAKRLFS